MRFVAGEYFADPKMFVQKSNSDYYAQNPQQDPGDFLFHSDFSYFQWRGEVAGEVTFSGENITTRTEGPNGELQGVAQPTTKSSLVSVNFPFTVDSETMINVYDQDNDLAVPGVVVAYQSADAYRLITITLGNDGILFRNFTYTFESGIPSFTLRYKIDVYGRAISEGSDPGVLFRAQPGRITFGEGKFDTDVPYISADPQNPRGAVFTDSRTISTSNDSSGISLAFNLSGIRAAAR